MDESEQIELLYEALTQLLYSVEHKCVTVGDCNQARHALSCAESDELGRVRMDHSQFGVGA